MSDHPQLWSPDKHAMLQTCLEGFWADAVWDLDTCPLRTATAQRTGTLVFAALPSVLRVEVQYACWYKFTHGEWAINSGHRSLINRMVAWLGEVAPAVHSLVDWSLTQWLELLTTWARDHGWTMTRPHRYLDGTQQLRQQSSQTAEWRIMRQWYRVVWDAYDDRPEYAKDCWDLARLGVVDPLSRAPVKLSFVHITQPWLVDAAKACLWYCLVRYTSGTCQALQQAIQRFARFAATSAPTLTPTTIDRPLLLEYMHALHEAGLAPATRTQQLVLLRLFFALCVQEDWLPLPERPLITDDDLPRLPAPATRAIPQEVLDQLVRALPSLHPPFQLMVRVLQTCGLRINEVCTLPWACLHQDAEGDWFLRYQQHKLKKEHIIPITRELGNLLYEYAQSQRVAGTAPPRFMFVNPKGGAYWTRTLHMGSFGILMIQPR